MGAYGEHWCTFIDLVLSGPPSSRVRADSICGFKFYGLNSLLLVLQVIGVRGSESKTGCFQASQQQGFFARQVSVC